MEDNRVDFHNFLPRYLGPAFAEQAPGIYLSDLKMTDLEAGESATVALLHPQGNRKLMQSGCCHLVDRQGTTPQGELALHMEWVG